MLPDFHIPTPKLKVIEKNLNFFLKDWKKEIQEIDFTKSPLKAPFIKKLMERVSKYYDFFDQYLQESHRSVLKDIKCKAECSNCCHHYPSSVEPFELLAIYFHVRNSDEFMNWILACHENTEHFRRSYNQKIDVDKDYAPAVLEDLEEQVFHEYFKKQMSCGFLDPKGNCGIYNFRAVACRMYLSFTEGEFCKYEFLNTEQNKNFIVLLPDHTEILIHNLSECFEELGLSGNLFEGLLQLNEMEQEGFFNV